jgi:hypothetical protein
LPGPRTRRDATIAERQLPKIRVIDAVHPLFGHPIASLSRLPLSASLRTKPARSSVNGRSSASERAYSSWEGIRDWMPANIQQTDTVQQILAYEKCYKITGGYQNCVSAHEPLTYTDAYPLTKNSWVALNGGRMAELALAPGEKSHKP